MQQRVMERENIQILFEHNTLGLFGENGVEGAHLVKRKGEPDEQLVDIAIDGFFLAIGHKPNTDIFKSLWQATVPIPPTVRPLVLPVLAVRPLSRPSVSC